MNKYDDLKGKVAIVTGGAGSIGETAVKALRENGAEVFVADIKKPHCVDVSKENDVKQMVSRVMEKYKRIDILVNIAGIAFGSGFEDIDLETFYRNIDANLTPVWLCIQNVLPHMKKTGGAIVNISSVNGISGIGEAAYSAAKAGIDSLTRSTGVMYGRYGVRCNSIVLGTIATSIPVWLERLKKDPKVLEKIAAKIPRKKVGAPEEVGSIILFLASETSQLINATTIIADGGWTVACGTVRAKEGPWWED